ncbi:C6 zinc finger domain protein, partial [Rhexocercosporidium sp. MPI-PUGE-AT-0058]
PGASDPELEKENSSISKRTLIRKACNECRQQKLRCNTVKDPFTPCSRCTRLKIECRLDASFKRIFCPTNSSSRERRQQERRHSAANDTPPAPNDQSINCCGTAGIPQQGSAQSTNGIQGYVLTPSEGQYAGIGLSPNEFSWTETNQTENPGITSSHRPPTARHDEHSTAPTGSSPRQLDDIDISGYVARCLFEQYFQHYHPFLPFLDPHKSPDDYYQFSPLLFWVIVGVASRRYSADLTLLPALSISVSRLLWSTLQSSHHNYRTCKALCILCVWPFPKSDSSNDPTFMLTGAMMQLAMQAGLHMPDYSQDFSKVELTLRSEELRDRHMTWAVCNIVAQSVATGLGLPSTTRYECLMEPKLMTASYRALDEPLASRLRIELFCDRVTEALYKNPSHEKATGNTNERSGRFNLLSQELIQLESDLNPEMDSTEMLLYFRCAQIHLRLYALLDLSAQAPLLLLYQVCYQFLTEICSSDPNTVNIIRHCPYYIFQMVLASGLTLLRLLRSSLASYIDAEAGKSMFNSTILACRQISISNNDLPGRLAEVLAHLWAWGVRGTQDSSLSSHKSSSRIEYQDTPLVVRGRMSMSIIYDSLWMWRRGFKNDPARHLTRKDALVVQSRSFDLISCSSYCSN